MVSTHCTSVNALYSSLDGQRNVISTLGLLAVDNSGVCVRVEVGAGDCVPTVGGARLSSQYNQNGVSVTWSKGLVNIGVPDCSHGNMVVSVSCNVIGSRAILGINVMRQLDHHPGSHGLLGKALLCSFCSYHAITLTLPLRPNDWPSHNSTTDINISGPMVLKLWHFLLACDFDV